MTFFGDCRPDQREVENVLITKFAQIIPLGAETVLYVRTFGGRGKVFFELVARYFRQNTQ